MDQGSMNSPEPAGIAKTTSYSKHVAGLVREGTVAERVSELQAKLSSQNPVPNTSPNNPPSLNRPLEETPSAHPTSKPLLSPESLSIPETPIDRDLGKGLITEAEMRAMETQERSRKQMERMVNEGIEGVIVPNPTNTGYSSTMSQAALAALVSSRLVNSYSLSLDNLNEVSPIVPKDVPQSPQNQLKSSQEPTKKTGTPSSGNVYSKVLQFTSSPSIPSYIPRRQSQNFGTEEAPSPRKLKSMMFTDHGDENTSQTPLVAPKPPVFQPTRHQSTRYLRRRTMNTKSDNALRRNSEIGTPDTTATQDSKSTLGDVFLSPIKTTKTCHIERPLMGGGNKVVSTNNPHDINNPNYVPSVMPRHVDYHRMLRSRHARSTPVDSSSFSSVISSADWNELQGAFSTDGEGKTSTEKSKQPVSIDKLDNKTPMTDGARSGTESEDDFDSTYGAIRDLFAASLPSESQVSQNNLAPKMTMESPRPKHGDEAL